MSEYNKYYEDFDLPESWKITNKCPIDIKRIISHGDHIFQMRFYIFSESQRQVYKLDSDLLHGYKIGNSLMFTLVDNMNKRDSFPVNDLLIARNKNMSKIELPKLR